METVNSLLQKKAHLFLLINWTKRCMVTSQDAPPYRTILSELHQSYSVNC